MSLYTSLRKEHTRTWRLWYVMNQRCDPEWRAKYTPHNTSFFKICDDWSIIESGPQGFINFIDDMGDCDNISQIYRYNTSEEYNKLNCRKGTYSDRARRSRVYLGQLAVGKRKAVKNGIPPWAYYGRVRRDWTIKQAQTTPYLKTHKAKRNLLQRIFG